MFVSTIILHNLLLLCHRWPGLAFVLGLVALIVDVKGGGAEESFFFVAYPACVVDFFLGVEPRFCSRGCAAAVQYVDSYIVIMYNATRVVVL